MLSENLTLHVRQSSKEISILDLQGEVTRFAETKLMDAYAQLSSQGVRVIIFNFTDMVYMNSSGIGLLITLLIRSSRMNQRLMGYGLNPHLNRIFELTRLHEAIPLYASEAAALTAAVTP